MTRLVIAGAAGRMGRMIVAACAGHEDARVTGALERRGNPAIGQDAGLLAGLGPSGVKVAADVDAALKDADVLIDFTSPEAAAEHAAVCAARGAAMVVGTTGLDETQKAALAKAAKKVPVVFSPNMSVGVNLLFKVLEDMARVLGPGYDVEIVEAHHNRKKDAPSGTAARMLEVVARGLDLDPGAAAVYGRRGNVGARPEGEIGIHAVRAGDIVGDHTVLFAGPAERIEVVHRAHSRETFARGAVRAALWIKGKAPGLYDMADVLGLR